MKPRIKSKSRKVSAKKPKRLLNRRLKLKDTGLAIGFKGADVPPIAFTHRSKSAFWNKEKNYGCSPTDPDMTYGSARSIVWTCPKDPSHEWVMRVNEFCTRKVDCLFCATQPAESGKSLLEKSPELSRQWDKRLNKHKTPRTTKCTASYKAFWNCENDKNHNWRACVRSRTLNMEGCPFCHPCTKRKDSLSGRHPEIAEIWDYDSNEGLTPESIRFDSGVSVYWICEEGHRTLMAVNDRVAYGTRCRSCGKAGRDFLSLFEKFPDIAAEWDQKKNKLKPYEVPAGSGMVAYWICKEGHSWQISIAARTASGSDCPYCMGTLISEEYSLETAYPEIAEQWHKKKNGKKKPADFFPASVDRAWWQCPVSADHEWETRIVDRTSHLSGCPFCAGQKSALSNSLSKNFPTIASELHPTRNNNIDPAQIYEFSGKQLWWQCTIIAEHVWKTKVSTRTKFGTGCPECMSYRAKYKESLAYLYPEVAKEWHPTANPTGPERLKPFSGKKVWWRCLKNTKHEWQAVISNRTLAKTSCPYCTNQKIDASNCLATTMPELAREFHPTKNGKLTPFNISSGSRKDVVWRCLSEYEHEWTAKPNTRTSKKQTGCPFCAHKLIDDTNSLAALHPSIAREWHKQKNGSLDPKKLSSTHPKSVWWKCTKNKKHEWEETVVSRTRSQLPCPFCSGRKASRENSIVSTHPALAREWHETKNGDLAAEDVMANCSKSVWWRCKKGPDHVWSAPVTRRALLGNRCPFCMKKKASVTNSLQSLYPEIASEFHPTRNGKLKASDFLPQSNKIVWWRCSKNSRHAWEAPPSVRFKGSGCPHCRKGR